MRLIDEFEIPNLDATQEVDELAEAAQKLRDLAAYCARKADAVQYRLDGNIPAALDREKSCDLIYQRLPASWRW